MDGCSREKMIFMTEKVCLKRKLDRDAENTSAPAKMSSGYGELKERPSSTCSQGEEIYK